MRSIKKVLCVTSVVAVAGLGVVAAAGSASAAPVPATFSTPGTSTFTVPAGICTVSVDASGAA